MAFFEDNMIGKTIGLKPNADSIKLLNRVMENLGIDNENYSNNEAIFMVFEALDKKKPIEKKIEVSKTADIQLIEQLKSQILELDKQLNDSKVSLLEATEQYTAIEKKLATYEKVYNQGLEKSEAEMQRLNSTIESLQSQINSKVDLLPNQLIITLTEMQQKYLKRCISKKAVKEFVNSANAKGKFSEIIPAFTGKDNDDILNLLLAWLFICAKDGKYPLIDFDDFIAALKAERKVK